MTTSVISAFSIVAGLLFLYAGLRMWGPSEVNKFLSITLFSGGVFLVGFPCMVWWYPHVEVIPPGCYRIADEPSTVWIDGVVYPSTQRVYHPIPCPGQ